MGTHKSKGIKQDIPNMAQMNEEPDYQVQTRTPMPSSWKLNILRGKRESELNDEAMPVTRRKCHKKVNTFALCESKEGKFWTVFNCQEEFQNMQKCFDRELEVEMDKLRRNLQRNDEWWWRDLYDEDGEIGRQKEWNGDPYYKLMISDLQNKLSGNNKSSGQKETTS